MGFINMRKEEDLVNDNEVRRYNNVAKIGNVKKKKKKKNRCKTKTKQHGEFRKSFHNCLLLRYPVFLSSLFDYYSYNRSTCGYYKQTMFHE